MTGSFSGKLLTIVFFLLTVLSVVLVSKAGLATLKISSSVAYSVVYFLMFGAAFVFTKHIFYPMKPSHKYALLLLFFVINTLLVFWLQYQM